MSDSILIGSICLTDIPKELIKRVVCKDGKERAYLNLAIIEKKQPQSFTNNGITRTYTHFISCAPKKEERKDGVNYILGDLETRQFASRATTSAPTAVAKPAPIQGGSNGEILPF